MVDELSQKITEAMERLPLFPLMDVAPLPGSITPLHIFEPRYREMLADCLARNRVLALATVGKTKTPNAIESGTMRPIIGAGIIVANKMLDDGRSFVLLRGVCRAMVDEFLPINKPYLLVRAHLIEDESDASQVSASKTDLELLRGLLYQLSDALPGEDAIRHLATFGQSEANAGYLADVVGGALISSVRERQRLLQETSVTARVESVIRRVARVLAQATTEPARAAN